MKKRIFMIAAACAALAACSKEPVGSAIVSQEEGSIVFTVAGEDPAATKAVSAYTTAQTYESQVNKVQLFVFGSDGAINFYQNLGTSTSGSISTTAGTKTVWAVVNGPDLSTIGTLSALQATAVDLSANSTTASTGFVMA